MATSTGEILKVRLDGPAVAPADPEFLQEIFTGGSKLCMSCHF